MKKKSTLKYLFKIKIMRTLKILTLVYKENMPFSLNYLWENMYYFLKNNKYFE